MTRQQKIASLLMLHVAGTDEEVVRAFAEEHRPGGLIFMPDNISPTLADIARLARAATLDEQFPVLIALDQEGGQVRRITADTFASAGTLRHRPPSDTFDAFAQRSGMLVAAGISVNFGIVADVTVNPDSFISSRVLGETSADAADRVRAAVRGEAGRVLRTLKHFPGHGRTEGDSHTSVPETDIDLETWSRTDAVPFAAGIAAGAELVMVGHLRYAAVDDAPATLSRTWHTILRERLGFDGVIITDDMLMLRDSGIAEYRNPAVNAVRALAAGATMLLYVLRGNAAVDGTDPTRLVAEIGAAIDDGRLTNNLIDAAALKLLKLRFQARPAAGLESTPH
ncbi:glycoside hydrolase family 3 N-terminal domain-containing protein [Mycetocola zhadangensis]|nr:glycoside hydrolase family 3 N-terminal domain-containing protein [Mycetocola zhadangensis]